MLGFLSPRKRFTFIHKKSVGHITYRVRGTGIPTSQTGKAHAKREHPSIIFVMYSKLPVFGHQNKSERFN